MEQAEENGVDYARENDSTEVEDIQIVCLVELVLSKDSMEDTIAVVCMHDALKEVLNGRNDCYMGRKEEGTVWQYCAEATHDEEEELDDRQKNRAVDELIEDHTQTSVQNRAMLEEKIADAIDVTHLHIRACQ